MNRFAWTVAVLMLVNGCKNEEPAATKPVAAAKAASAPGATPAGKPAAAPTPATEPTRHELKDLGISVTAPGCSKLTTTPGYAAGKPATYVVGPSTPSCPLDLMGISIRDAETDFGPTIDEAKKFISQAGDTPGAVETLPDGFSLSFTGTSREGVVVIRKIGARNISCRGAGREEQATAVRAACNSITAL